MTITRCSLGLIRDRGLHVTQPNQLADLEADERAFLERHVSELRSSIGKETAVRARFRPESDLLERFTKLLDAEASEQSFLNTSSALIDSLAVTMKQTARAEDCVIAIVISKAEDDDGTDTATLLKLDAEIEGANLEPQEDGSIRLQVYQHLLPAPGKLQKGISWPDKRPDSELILLDTNRSAAAQYFQNAFAVEASPRPVDAERVLSEQIQKLGPERAVAIAAKVKEQSGPADRIAAEIKKEFPELDTSPTELGGSGGFAGTVRPGKMWQSKYSYKSDGIELHVPVTELGRVTVTADGTEFVTTIRTSHPLGPYSAKQNLDDSAN